MIVYKDMTFCVRKGCTKKKCERHLSNVDWSYGLPVSVADFWKKTALCPELPPKSMEIKDD